MTFDLIEIAKGEPGRFWHINDNYAVRVDTFFCFTQRSARKGWKAGSLGLVRHGESGLSLRQICAMDLDLYSL